MEVYHKRKCNPNTKKKEIMMNIQTNHHVTNQKKKTKYPIQNNEHKHEHEHKPERIKKKKN